MDQPIIFEQVSHVYNPNSPFEVRALDNVNCTIPSGIVTAIIGHTGSGKSTLIQHLNALLRPTQGRMIIDGEEFTATSENKNLKQLRKKVSIVFQFPESQLFEETVLKDVMFGPLNFGSTEEEAEAISRQMLERVGISEVYFERSPFDLSGGQMRRVAIAGILACQPEVLVLDEPTAGLDPMGQKDMMELFMQLQRDHNLTLILVTHKMEDVAEYADYAIMMEAGTVINSGTPHEIFSSPEWLESKQLNVPKSMQFYMQLRAAQRDILAGSNFMPLNKEELADYIVRTHQGLVEGEGRDEH